MRNNLEHKCLNLNEKYGPTVFQYLTNTTKKFELCAQFGDPPRCQPGESTEPERPFGCPECVAHFRFYTESFLKYGNWSVGVLKTIFCDPVHPEENSYACADIINAYVPLFVHLIRDIKNWNWYCSYVDLCPANQLLKTSAALPRRFLKVDDDSVDLCAKCKSAVDFVQTQLKFRFKNFNAQIICYDLAPSLKNHCINFWNKYGRAFFEDVKNNMNMDQICINDLQLCTEDEAEYPDDENQLVSTFPFSAFSKYYQPRRARY